MARIGLQPLLSVPYSTRMDRSLLLACVHWNLKQSPAISVKNFRILGQRSFRRCRRADSWAAHLFVPWCCVRWCLQPSCWPCQHRATKRVNLHGGGMRAHWGSQYVGSVHSRCWVVGWWPSCLLNLPEQLRCLRSLLSLPQRVLWHWRHGLHGLW